MHLRWKMDSPYTNSCISQIQLFSAATPPPPPPCSLKAWGTSITSVCKVHKDRVSYIMFKHLSDNVILLILKLYNKIWREGIIPKTWILIPILKPAKDPTKLESYRPISSTSNLCKWMGKMIVQRGNYEKMSKYSKYQSGFRRSTIDALSKVSNEIEKAINMQEILRYRKDIWSYDTVWREGLLYKV